MSFVSQARNRFTQFLGSAIKGWNRFWFADGDIPAALVQRCTDTRTWAAPAAALLLASTPAVAKSRSRIWNRYFRLSTGQVFAQATKAISHMMTAKNIGSFEKIP